MNEVETLVIKNLLLDEEYVRKALPFIKSEYFSTTTGKKLFEITTKYLDSRDELEDYILDTGDGININFYQIALISHHLSMNKLH